MRPSSGRIYIVIAIVAVGVFVFGLPASAQEKCDPYWYTQTGYCLVPPINLTATQTANSITISWRLNLNGTEPNLTRIYRGSTLQLRDFPVSALEDPQNVDHFNDLFSYTDSGRQPSTTYVYSVCSVYGWTNECTTISAKTLAGTSPGPQPPSNLSLILSQPNPPLWFANLHWDEDNFVGIATVWQVPPVLNTGILNANIDSNVSHHYQTFFPNLPPGGSYTFNVCNQQSGAQSCASVVAQTGPPLPPPPPVPPPQFATNLKAVQLQAPHGTKLQGTKFNQLSWKLVPNNPAQWLRVQYRIFLVNPTGTGLRAGQYLWLSANLPGNATSYVDFTALNFLHDYRVCGAASGQQLVICSDASNRVNGP